MENQRLNNGCKRDATSINFDIMVEEWGLRTIGRGSL